MRRGSVDEGQEEQLADTEGRGMRRVAVVGVDQVRPARLRGLDVGGPGPVVVDEEHPGRHGATGRVLDRGRQRLATEGLAEHVEEPGTAVRHGREHEVVVRRRGGPPAGHRHRRLPGGQRPGEPGRGEDDAHTVMLAGPPARHVRTQMFCRFCGVTAVRTDKHLSPVARSRSAGRDASGAATADRRPHGRSRGRRPDTMAATWSVADDDVRSARPRRRDEPGRRDGADRDAP